MTQGSRCCLNSPRFQTLDADNFRHSHHNRVGDAFKAISGEAHTAPFLDVRGMDQAPNNLVDAFGVRVSSHSETIFINAKVVGYCSMPRCFKSK